MSRSRRRPAGRGPASCPARFPTRCAPNSSPSAATCTCTRSSATRSSAPPPRSRPGWSRRACSPRCCRSAPASSVTSARRGWDGDRPMLALRADIDALPIPDTKTRARTARPSPTAPTPAATTCTPPSSSAPGSSSPSWTAQGRCRARCGCSSSPPRRCCPAAPPTRSRRACWTASAGSSPCTATRRVDVGPDRAAAPARSPPPATGWRSRLDGPGGHTARPHLTTDLVTAAAKVVTEVPALLARRVDARAGLAVTWGRIESGPRLQRHPAARRAVRHGPLPGPRRLAGGPRPGARGDRRDRRRCTAPSREINYVRGVPPVVNEPGIDRAAARRDGRPPRRARGRGHRAEPGRRGLLLVPGARARRDGPAGRAHRRATRRRRDLHQGDFDVDEAAITVGVELFTAAALLDGQ